MATTVGSAGNAIAYEVRGSGPDLVLVHGITESRASWGPVPDRLAEGHRVIAVDLPGHGESEPRTTYGLDELADDLAAVVEAADADKPALVGHSLGGAVVSVYAARHPAAAVVNVDQPLALAAFQAQVLEFEPALRSEAFGDVITGLFDELMGPLDAAGRAQVTTARRAEQEVVLGVWDPLFTLDADALDALVRDLLAGLDQPYLSLHGADPGPEYAAWLSEVVPQAELEVWPDHGHYPHLVATDRFLDRVESFLRG